MRLHYKNLASRPTATTGRNIKTSQQYKTLLQNAVKQSVKHKETSKNNWWDNTKNFLSGAAFVTKAVIYTAAQPLLNAASFVSGALSALADDLGFTAGQRSASGSLPAYSAPFDKQTSGRILRHGAALVAGFLGIIGGSAIVSGGAAVTTTGVLAPAGAVALVGGAVVATAGVAVVASATANITAGDPNIQFSSAQGNGAVQGDSRSNISEASKERWGQGTFDSVEDSLEHHFKKHGEEVGAKDLDQYVRKAEGFSQNLKGADKSFPDNGTSGAVRYTKNGKYIIIGPDGKILSYGLAR